MKSKPELLLRKTAECMLNHNTKPKGNTRHSTTGTQISHFLLLMKVFVLNCKIIGMSVNGWNSLLCLLHVKFITYYSTYEKYASNTCFPPQTCKMRRTAESKQIRSL